MSDEKTIFAPVLQEKATTHLKACPALLQYDGGGAGKRFLLTQSQNIIGRRADRVQVWIDDASVSREHCRIDLMPEGGALLTDLGSLNHTYVNDQAVSTSTKLAHSDMVRVGNVRLRYFAQGSADQLLFDRIYRMAVTDRMLNVFRRDYFLEKLEEEFNISKLQNSPLALAFIDLDKFKNINDTHGHECGDFVLKETCRNIKSQLRAQDLLGRYGGEEFVLLMPKTSLQQAFELCDAIRLQIQNASYEYEGKAIPVTLSMGVCLRGPSMETPDELIKMADHLVYESKRNGRNQVSKA